MEIPFADVLRGRFGPSQGPRRAPAFDLTAGCWRTSKTTRPKATDAALDTVDLPSADPALLLQKMENRLVRNHLANPDVLSGEQLRKLRYILNFARLADFEPGAAGPGGSRGPRGRLGGRRDRAVALQGRRRVVRAAARGAGSDQGVDGGARRAGAACATTRTISDRCSSIATRNDFSAAELDAEVGYKKLVTVLGGGGGAGFVYIGGMQRLLEAGQVPDYMIGSSFGSIIGSLVARELPVPIEEYVAWAKTVSYRAILGPERVRRRHGMAGLFALRFDQFAHALLSREDGERMRMSDLAIPFDVVVAGVRRQPYAALPSQVPPPRAGGAAVALASLPPHRNRPVGGGAHVAGVGVHRLAGGQADRRLRRRSGTATSTSLDAASFSSAIPGVLHHETSDPRMLPLLEDLFAQRDIAALVDGGAASNVPVELAWKRVRDGKLGTRNACYLAFDCFHPQWDSRHLWLAPILQAIQLQMLRNLPYADHLVRFEPTLSPINLAPSTTAIDRACRWGTRQRRQGDPGDVGAVAANLVGRRRARRFRAAQPQEHAKSVASSMSSVMAAIQLAERSPLPLAQPPPDLRRVGADYHDPHGRPGRRRRLQPWRDGFGTQLREHNSANLAWSRGNEVPDIADRPGADPSPQPEQPRRPQRTRPISTSPGPPRGLGPPRPADLPRAGRGDRGRRLGD